MCSPYHILCYKGGYNLLMISQREIKMACNFIPYTFGLSHALLKYNEFVFRSYFLRVSSSVSFGKTVVV